MKRLSRLFCMMLTLCILTALPAVPAAAKTPTWSSLKISGRKTLKTYLSGTASAATFTTKDLKTPAGSVDESTELVISAVGKNSAGTWYAYLKNQEAYIPLSAVTTATDSFVGSFRVSSKIKTVYRRRARVKYGRSYISKKKKAYVIDTKSSSTMAQVIYPVTGGWKMAWVDYSAFATLKLNRKAATICTGTVSNTVQLSVRRTPSFVAGNLTWSSSNTSVATVSSTGLVTSTGAGSAVITVKDTGTGRSATCKVTVRSPYTILNVTSAKLAAGNTKQLRATLRPSASAAVTWTSSDSTVATVSGSGLVTAVKAGTATITASANGYTAATCKITVVNWQWPSKTRVIKRRFGIYSAAGAKAGTPYHAGVDITGSSGVCAASAGTVAFKGYGTSGYTVILKHTVDGKTVFSMYSHLKNYNDCPAAGTAVKAGQKIGVMGKTRSTHGVHLHFAIFSTYAENVSSYAKNRVSADIVQQDGNTFYNPSHLIKYQKLPTP